MPEPRHSPVRPGKLRTASSNAIPRIPRRQPHKGTISSSRASQDGGLTEVLSHYFTRSGATIAQRYYPVVSSVLGQRSHESTISPLEDQPPRQIRIRPTLERRYKNPWLAFGQKGGEKKERTLTYSLRGQSWEPPNEGLYAGKKSPPRRDYPYREVSSPGSSTTQSVPKDFRP